MAIVKKMYAKDKASLIEFFEDENRKRAERMITAYLAKIKESAKKQKAQ